IGVAAGGRARLQELLGVLESDRIGRDLGVVAVTWRTIVVGPVIAMPLAWVAAVASIRIVAATVVAMVAVTGPAARASRTCRTCRTGGSG
ncbi:hypothetical protein, partial [Mesorhizobium sp. M7A.F.Ca.CA.001.11.2.1]|uniref:hypothetical protein n=1 Tax=Mesorhizobium sp. M7A.F.Ca.CA.001.11.2.1 TaxID=2496693 RepID=UPI001FE00473